MKISKKRLRQIIKEEIENHPGNCDDRTDEEVYAKMYDALRPGMDPDAPEWDPFIAFFEEYVYDQMSRTNPENIQDFESEDYDEIEPLPPPHEEYKV
jgi:hypothetical protein